VTSSLENLSGPGKPLKMRSIIPNAFGWAVLVLCATASAAPGMESVFLILSYSCDPFTTLPAFDVYGDLRGAVDHFPEIGYIV